MLKLGKYPHGGFTLIELLVVVLIIGILAAIALPQYQLAVGKAKIATLKENAHAIRNAMDRYHLVHDAYPDNLNVLDIEIQDGASCWIQANNLVYCFTRVFGTGLSYVVGYGYRYNQKGCHANSGNLNDIANRLCQQETGKTTPDEDGGTMYKAYYY